MVRLGLGLQGTAHRRVRQALWLVFGAVGCSWPSRWRTWPVSCSCSCIAARELAVPPGDWRIRGGRSSAASCAVLVLTAAGAAAGAALSTALVRLFATTFATVPRMNSRSTHGRSAQRRRPVAPPSSVSGRRARPRGESCTRRSRRGTRRVRNSHLQRGLVMSQIALSVVLAASAGLLLRSYNNLTRVDLG